METEGQYMDMEKDSDKGKLGKEKTDDSSREFGKNIRKGV